MPNQEEDHTARYRVMWSLTSGQERHWAGIGHLGGTVMTLTSVRRDRGGRVSGIESNMKLLKWMTGTNVALTAAVLFRLLTA